MTDKQLSITDKAFIRASGYFLTSPYPNNWIELDESDFFEFIYDHLTEDYEDWDTSSVMTAISELASQFIYFAQEVRDTLNENSEV